MSSDRSLTRSQARSLLSIAKLKIARSRLDRAISKRTRMDQTCFGSRGLFWPMSNPLFQGRWPRSAGRTGIGGLRTPPSASLYRERIILYRLSTLTLPRRCSQPTTCGAKRSYARDAGSIFLYRIRSNGAFAAPNSVVHDHKINAGPFPNRYFIVFLSFRRPQTKVAVVRCRNVSLICRSAPKARNHGHLSCRTHYDTHQSRQSRKNRSSYPRSGSCMVFESVAASFRCQS
jgi:hypothetical protein